MNFARSYNTIRHFITAIISRQFDNSIGSAVAARALERTAIAAGGPLGQFARLAGLQEVMDRLFG